MGSKQATDFLVETANPAGLDATLQQFGAALVGGGMPGGYVTKDGLHVMRVFGDPGFVRFMVERQGYCRVVEQLDKLV